MKQIPKYQSKGKLPDDSYYYQTTDTSNGTTYNVHPSAFGAKELTVTTPEVKVTARHPSHQYRSVFDPTAAWEPVHGALELLGKAFNKATDATGTTEAAQKVMPWLMPSQYVGWIRTDNRPGTEGNTGFGEDKMGQYINEMFDLGVAPAVMKGVKGTVKAAGKTMKQTLLPLEDVVRKNLLVNRKLGTLNPYKIGKDWQWDANGKMFGRQLGEGSEQFVFENLKDPKSVLKIENSGYSSPIELKQGIERYQMRNRIPYQEHAKYLGYMEGKNTTGKTVYYPVFKQNRLYLEKNTTPAYWDNILVPRINRMMSDKGYRGSANSSFSNGKYTVSDMSPHNIGYNSNGQLRFFDFYVE